MLTSFPVSFAPIGPTLNLHTPDEIFSVMLRVSSTQELDRQSFDDLMPSGRNGMIKFYQPWCGHCTRMKPDWDLLAEQAHSSVFIADVNCQVEKDLCADHHPGGTYPTVLVFQQGKEPELYQGGRGVEDLLKFVNNYLVEKCNLGRLEETCSEKEQKYVTKWKEKDVTA